MNAVMKRTISLFFALLLCAVWLSGCGGAALGVDQNSQGTSAADSPPPDVDIAVKVQKIDESGLPLTPETQSVQSQSGAPTGVVPVVQGTSAAVSPQPAGGSAVKAQKVDKSGFRLAPEIQSEQWLNGAPVKLQDLRGKVVVIDFWTFG